MAQASDFAPLRNKARQYQNITTGEVISLRQYQKIQRGGLTYTQYVKTRGSKKEYKTKGHTKVNGLKKPAPIQAVPPPTQEAETPAIRRRKTATEQEAQDRVRTMKESWARSRSQEYGVQLTFDQLPMVDKSLFWEQYHSLMANGSPDYEYYLDELQDYFDLSYEDWGDIAYGDTP